jgi:hypothetical protein
MEFCFDCLCPFVMIPYDINYYYNLYMYQMTYFGIQCSLVKPSPSVQLVVWRYNEFGDKLRDIENRKLCDHMKR